MRSRGSGYVPETVRVLTQRSTLLGSRRFENPGPARPMKRTPDHWKTSSPRPNGLMARPGTESSNPSSAESSANLISRARHGRRAASCNRLSHLADGARPVRQSAETSARGAQRLHDCGMRSGATSAERLRPSRGATAGSSKGSTAGTGSPGGCSWRPNETARRRSGG
jgi:hypothetical protein